MTRGMASKTTPTELVPPAPPIQAVPIQATPVQATPVQVSHGQAGQVQSVGSTSSVGASPQAAQQVLQETFDDLEVLESIQDLPPLKSGQLPRFMLAKNRARFQRMLTWYKNKWAWLNIAPLSGVNKLFKQQTKELEGIRAHKLDYEMEIEMGALTPSQRSYKFDELKMCKAHEKLAVCLLSKMQIKIKSGRR